MRVYLSEHGYCISIGEYSYFYEDDHTLSLVGRSCHTPESYIDVTPYELYSYTEYIPTIDDYMDSQNFNELRTNTQIEFYEARVKSDEYHLWRNKK
jgi:hypothetical protein